MSKRSPDPSGTPPLDLVGAHERTRGDEPTDDAFANEHWLHRWADEHGEDASRLAAEARGEA